MGDIKSKELLDLFFTEREASDSGRGEHCVLLNVQADQAQDRPDQARREASVLLYKHSNI